MQKPLLELDVAEFERPISAAMRSHFITIQAAARHMVPQGSGVILLFGGGGPQTLPGLGGFKVALDAMEGMRRQWALELGRHGIRVVTIKTGGIPETIDESSTRREEIARSIEEATLLKRAATLNDLGNVAVFLASDKSRAITATDINISAGSIID